MVENALLRDPRISPQCKALYGLLITYGPERIFPGQETLAACLGTTRQTVSRWLSELRDLGLIGWERRTGTSNKYYILGYSNFLEGGVTPTLQGCNASVTGDVIPTLHDLEPVNQNQEPEEEPPAADSPSQFADEEFTASFLRQGISADIGDPDDSEEIAALFPEPKPPQRRTTEQAKAGIQRAVETFANTGGRPGVADPTKDEGWRDVAYSFGDAFLGMTEDQVRRKPNLDAMTYKLKELTTAIGGVTLAHACQVMKPLAVIEDWMVGPSATPYNTRWAEAYQNALVTDTQTIKDRAVAKLKKTQGGARNGGSSGPRNEPTPTPKFEYIEPEWLGALP
jgi:hypothetical protein